MLEPNVTILANAHSLEHKPDADDFIISYDAREFARPPLSASHLVSPPQSRPTSRSLAP